MITDMPTGRSGTAAIAIPNFGILVLRGINENGRLATAEVLDVEKGTWTTIVSMIKPRLLPSVIAVQNNILVVGNLDDMDHFMERLTISPNLPLQWTMVNSAIFVPENITSLCTFKDDFVISCKLGAFI